MSKLRTPTGLRIGGTWLQPGDVVPDNVAGFDYAKAARKGLIEHEDGEAVVNPEGPAAHATAEDAAPVSDLEQANHDLKASLEQAQAKAAELEGAFGRAQTDRDEARQELDRARAELDTQATQHADALTRTTSERDGLQIELDQTRAALEDLQNAPAPVGLPADAHARLVAIKGVGEKLADEILAALTRVD